MTSVAFQSNLRKQIRKLPNILKSVKIIHNYSILFIRVLRHDSEAPRRRALANETRSGDAANFTGLVLGCTSYGARPQARAVNLSLTNFQRTAHWVRWRIRQAAGRTRGCPHGMADGQSLADGRTKARTKSKNV